MQTFTRAHFLLLRKKAHIERSFRAYLTLSCLYIGFVIPPLSIATWIQTTFWPIAGLLLLLVMAVLIILYALRVWTQFWALPGKTVHGYLALSGLAGTAASYAFVFVTTEPVWETDDRVCVDFGYTSRPWLGLETIPPAVRMGGETHIERRGVFIVVFSTLVPADQRVRLAPAFAHIRSSLVINQMVLW